ncbi:MAG: RagB/SusD domain protein [Chitinophagaceae bacterium]|nr:RagB/SusD domain protein [Chitinophagaceae bacterium]
MKNTIRNIGYIICTITGLTSCKKFVEIAPSSQFIVTSAIFSNDYTALSAVEGVYTSMRSGTVSFANGAISIYTGLSSDEIYNTSSSSTYDPFFKNSIPSNNSAVSSIFWASPYNTIYRTNSILEGLNTSMALSDSVKKQLTGEMKVIRALTYFYLTNLYGDIPLIISSDYKLSSTEPRTASSKIYLQIITDLTDAQSLLSNNYPSSGRARPNKQTATALLARVYLYQKDWSNAFIQASQVINSNLYSLATDLNSVFIENSNETIWEIASPSESRNTAEGTLFIPSSATVKPPFTINPYLLNAFETGDKRKTNWLKSNTVSGTTYYYPYKFKNRATSPVTEYDVVFRLAEQYLIRAEAQANGAGNGLSGAINDLNFIRKRAGLVNYSGLSDITSILNAVTHERQVELFTEWGNRWFDLKRSGIIDSVIGTEKTGWQSYKALYPIPYSQLNINPFLTQNTGYN